MQHPGLRYATFTGSQRQLHDPCSQIATTVYPGHCESRFSPEDIYVQPVSVALSSACTYSIKGYYQYNITRSRPQAVAPPTRRRPVAIPGLSRLRRLAQSHSTPCNERPAAHDRHVRLDGDGECSAHNGKDSCIDHSASARPSTSSKLMQPTQ